MMEMIAANLTNITKIQQVRFNGAKATRYELRDENNCYAGSGMVFGWFKTPRGILNQKIREKF